MKNIHILSTDKPSRFLYNSTLKSFCIQKEIDGMFINDGKVSGADFWGLEKALNNGFNPYNIYITSDEEIKEGDWYYYFGHIINYEYDEHTLTPNCKKIILTTDGDLIKDGVQSIDDEFLQWFVKNPSCEEVEVDSIETNPDYKSNWENRFTYKIIIPKEEPKQETFEEAAERLAKDAYKKHSVKDDKLSLDEQIQRSGGFIVGFKEGMIEGAKWQQERMYSEEEVQVKLYECLGHFAQKHNIIINSSEIDQWFKQFKKK